MLVTEKFVAAPSNTSMKMPWMPASVVASVTRPVMPPPWASAKSRVALAPAGTVMTSAVLTEDLLLANTMANALNRATAR